MLKDAEETKCCFCLKREENISHLLLFECVSAWKIWNARYLWWGIQSVLHSGVANQFLQHEGVVYNNKFRSAWMVVRYATVWTLWTWRYQRIFGAQQDKEEEIIELVKCRSFSWVES